MADQPPSPGSAGGTGVRPGQRSGRPADPLVSRVGASATRQMPCPHLPMKPIR
jgi:hypothetical protein